MPSTSVLNGTSEHCVQGSSYAWTFNFEYQYRFQICHTTCLSSHPFPASYHSRAWKETSPHSCSFWQLLRHGMPCKGTKNERSSLECALGRWAVGLQVHIYYILYHSIPPLQQHRFLLWCKNTERGKHMQKSVVCSLAPFWVTRWGPVWENTYCSRKSGEVTLVAANVEHSNQFVQSIAGGGCKCGAGTFDLEWIANSTTGKLNLLYISSKNTFRNNLNVFYPIFSNRCNKVKLKSVSLPATSLGNGTALP